MCLFLFKVKEYIDHLKLFKINIDILKETDIVGCLRALRAKQNSAYSSHASDLITAWKAKCNSTDGEPASKSCKPVANGTAQGKKEPLPVNGGQASGKLDSAAAVNGKKRSISDPHSLESKVKVESVKAEPSFGKPDDDLVSKRQKLSYSDYKSSKTSATATADSSYRANFSSIDEYGDNIEDEVNSSAFLNDIPNKKTAPAALTKTKSERYSPSPCEASKHDNDKLMKAPPVPLAPLSAILPAMPTSTTPQYSSTTSAYRPPAQSMSEYAISAANDEEFLDKVFKSRNSKKTLYVGKKKTDGTLTVPKLYDLCVQSLRTSLDDLPDRLYKHSKHQCSPNVLNSPPSS